jgi:short-subunit dehydrogenase involved in D-alanine esterification of teichoic acids
MSTNQMKKKTVIITGANSGIGLETAKELAGRGQVSIYISQKRNTCIDVALCGTAHFFIHSNVCYLVLVFEKGLVWKVKVSFSMIVVG